MLLIMNPAFDEENHIDGKENDLYAQDIKGD